MSENENTTEIEPIFQGGEEIVGKYAYQSAIISPGEAEQLRQMVNAESLVPGLVGHYAVKQKVGRL